MLTHTQLDIFRDQAKGRTPSDAMLRIMLREYEDVIVQFERDNSGLRNTLREIQESEDRDSERIDKLSRCIVDARLPGLKDYLYRSPNDDLTLREAIDLHKFEEPQ